MLVAALAQGSPTVKRKTIAAWTLVLALSIGIGLVVSLTVRPEQAHAVSVITVNTTGDGPVTDWEDTICSLREAITWSNADLEYGDCAVTESDRVIRFDLPGPGTPVINLYSKLPDIDHALEIDGGSNRVELRAQYDSFQAVLYITENAGNTIINRLVINNYQSGIAIDVHGDGSTIKGSFIGTVSNGSVGLTNDNGVAVNADNVTIGGTDGTTPGGPCTGDCNLISGMRQFGIIIGGLSPATNTRVVGNFIGSDATGTTAVPND
jgi:CSLREA domain-containing protein